MTPEDTVAFAHKLAEIGTFNELQLSIFDDLAAAARDELVEVVLLAVRDGTFSDRNTIYKIQSLHARTDILEAFAAEVDARVRQLSNLT